MCATTLLLHRASETLPRGIPPLPPHHRQPGPAGAAVPGPAQAARPDEVLGTTCVQTRRRGAPQQPWHTHLSNLKALI